MQANGQVELSPLLGRRGVTVLVATLWLGSQVLHGERATPTQFYAA